MKTFLVALVCAFISFGFTLQNDSNWLTLKKDNYTVDFPSDWTLDSTGLMGSSFFLFSQVENGDDLFKENINLMVEDLTGLNVDLKAYADAAQGQVMGAIANAKMLENKKMKNGSVEYQRVVFLGEEGEMKLKFEQHYIVKNEKAYVLTFCAEKKNFSKYRKTAEKIMNSFVLK